MSTPSVAALVTAIRDQLSTAISPALADDGPKKLLAVIDHLLHTIEVRSEHDATKGAYEQARKHLVDGNYGAALTICWVTGLTGWVHVTALDGPAKSTTAATIRMCG